MKEPEGYDERKIKYALGLLSQEQRIDAFCMLVYLQWRSGTAGEAVSLSDVSRGAWVFHVRYPLKTLYRRIGQEIGNGGIMAMSAVILYCFLLILKSIS